MEAEVFERIIPQVLSYMLSTTDQKLKKWGNVINQFTGNHDNCPPHLISKLLTYSNDQSAIELKRISE